MTSRFFSSSSAGFAPATTTSVESSALLREMPEHHLSYGMITPQYSPDTTVAITLRHFEKEAKAQAEHEYDAENGELPPPPPEDDSTIDPELRRAHKKRRKVRSAIVSRRKTAIYAEKVEKELNNRDSVNAMLSKHLSVYKEVIKDIRSKIEFMQRCVDQGKLKRRRNDSDSLYPSHHVSQSQSHGLNPFSQAPSDYGSDFYHHTPSQSHQQQQKIEHVQVADTGGRYPMSLPTVACAFPGEMEADLDVSEDDPSVDLIHSADRHDTHAAHLLTSSSALPVSSVMPTAGVFSGNRMGSASSGGHRTMTGIESSSIGTTDIPKPVNEAVSVLESVGGSTNDVVGASQAGPFFLDSSQAGRSITNPFDTISVEEIDDVAVAAAVILVDENSDDVANTAAATTTLAPHSTTITTSSTTTTIADATHGTGTEYIVSTPVEDSEPCDVTCSKQLVEAALSECSDRNMSPVARKCATTTNLYHNNNNNNNNSVHQSQMVNQALGFMSLPPATNTQWEESCQYLEYF